MDGFQRFLGQDAPRTDTAAAMLAPALQGVPAEQHPRIALPVALMEPGQEPNQLLASSAGHHRTAGLPSLPRPSARTAPVPLTGLYAQVCQLGLRAHPQSLSHSITSAARMKQNTLLHGKP